MSRKRAVFIIILMSYLSLFGLAIGLLSGVAGNALPEIITHHPLRVLLALVGAGILGIPVSYWLYRAQSTTESPAPIVDTLNRQRMIEKVRAIWVKGVLEHSLHAATLIELGLKEQPDAVENPWRLAVQETEREARPLPAGTKIIRVYDEVGGELLILGEPGSGKSTLLLELARDLLDRAEKDENHPIPVVFNLSSWAIKRQPLQDWMVAELEAKYWMDRKIGQPWVSGNLILPLLDGLDEVRQEYLTACVESINTYRQEHGLLPIVVCCRSAEYHTKKTRIILNRAVIVQPLTAAQIDAYLASAGRQLDAVRHALHDDADLQEMATVPLMLSVLSLAYHGTTVDDLISTYPSARQQHIFNVYIRRMFDRRGVESRYTLPKTMHWMGWLARQLRQHEQTEMYLERMQPDWLTRRHLRHMYHALATLFVGLGVGLGARLVLGPILGPDFGLSAGLVVGPIAGVGAGLVIGLANKIEPTEILVWSWKKAIKILPATIAVGMVFGLMIGLGTGLVYGLSAGLVFGLVCEMTFGWSGDMLPPGLLLRPNQGIWYSVRNGVRGGLVTGVIIGSTFMLVGGLSVGLSIGFGIGLLTFFITGGDASFQYLALRLILWRSGCTPWHYVRFLNFAADRILLSHIGGGYIFIHRLLLEYCVSLNDTAHPSPTTVATAP